MTRDRTTVLAAALVVAGFVALLVAWAGVAGTLVIPSQVAFAASGGFGGFALVGTGVALLLVQQRRYDAAGERRAVARFSDEVADLAELIAARRRPVRRRRVLRAR